jgi:hypothetical protein
MEFIKQFFTGLNGKPSMQRLGSYTIISSICFCVIYLTVTTGKFPDMPQEAWYSMVGALCAKAYQRGKEVVAVEK